jgi:hypothetical protein
MPPDDTSAAIFPHVRIVMGMALGLGITWLLKGAAHFERFGVEYLVRTPIHSALCGGAMVAVNRKLHAAFVAGSLLYEASWIVRLFRTLT